MRAREEAKLDQDMGLKYPDEAVTIGRVGWILGVNSSR
jgi:hypothetical protein